MPQDSTLRIRSSRPGTPADEARLMSRVAQGDVRAFESLFRRYRPRLERYLGAHVRRADLVDEIVNDTMLVVWRRARAFAVGARVSTWIIGIAARTGLKASTRHRGYDAPDRDETLVDDTPELATLRRERERRLRAAIAALSVEHRAVLELAYFRGASCREAAATLGIPVDTVKTRMFHARRRLKTLLRDLEERAA